MKVLFAVSSESISEAIIKRYQKEYKEILSYKNVYYFNAILKEIQKDKTYDRIIISEDLEPFSNNNYDTIDKFIFEKLDSISDEAQDSHGKETSIILICTDRRVKGSSILVKLFGIGVYNALLGNDRSMDEVCKLINRPRTKKEAKMYYRIDTDDVNYKAENENEVSEVEIQNILAHFKKLGKNTAKYSDSFNNIAVQYTDEQLRIIVNCLPINVKAVLEANCERYQELMAVTGGIPSVKGIVSSNLEGTIKNEISEKKIGQAGKITKPIVIPSAVRNAKGGAKAPVAKKPVASVQVSAETQTKPTSKPVVKPGQVANQTVKPTVKPVETETPKRVISNANTMKTPSKVEPLVEEDLLPGFEDFEEINEVTTPNIQETTSVEEINLDNMLVDDVVLNNESQLPEIEDEIVAEEATARRGRGRPRKTPVSGVEVKPKGKRGRPRKIVEDPEEEIFEEAMLPGMEETILPGFEEIEEVQEEQEEMLPGMEFDEIEESDDLIPGVEDNFEYSDEETLLPGMEFEDEEDVLEEEDEEAEEDDMFSDFEEEEYEEVAEDTLPGLDFEDDFLSSDSTAIEDDFLPIESEDVEVEDDFLSDEEVDEDEYTEEVSLPGLDDLDDEFEIVEEEEEYEEVAEEEILPGMEFEEEDDDGLLPGFSETEDNNDDFEEETLLPGMGFEDEDNFDDMIPQVNNTASQNYESNSLESIKPRVDYSMSSLNSLITKDKKIVTFIGTSKNGTSFLVNNLAALFSSLGINTAILDMTQNKNSYYIYTKNEEELRNIAFNSIEKLQNGYAEGIRVDKNLTVYTALPNDGKDYSNAEPILSTLVQNHSLVLIDCDYDTDISYFASCQEMYLVQSMDILTIQPLTAFLRELKTKGVLEPEKIRIVINKELKVRSLSIKAIIGGLSYYNDPAMSFMTELFNRDLVKACTIPFEDNAYSKYLEGIVNCSISLNGYSKAFLSKLKVLGDMVYPLTSKQSYARTSVDYNQNAFSNSMNDTLNKMRKKY